MSSADLRKRLLSLRNITQDLKDSTTTPSINLNHIKTLITHLRGSSHTHPDIQDSPSPSLSPFPSPSPSSYNRLKPSQESKEESASQKELISLREDNLRLEASLADLRGRLPDRELGGGGQESRAGEELPFFRHCDPLEVFVCRFEIAESDYSKVEYLTAKVELVLDKLLLTHQEKGTIEEFDLTTFRRVIYLGSNVVIYQAEEFINGGYRINGEGEGDINGRQDRGLTNIFIRYASLEQLRRWDISIFSNYQLSTSLQQARVFEGHFARLHLQEQANKEAQFLQEVRSSQELSLLQQKELLQIYLRKKEEYIDVKNIVQDKIPLPKAPPRVSQPSQEVQAPLRLNGPPVLAATTDLLSVSKELPRKPADIHEETQVQENESRPEAEEFKGPLRRESKHREEPEQTEVIRPHQFSFSREKEVHVEENQLWQSQPYSPGQTRILNNHVSLPPPQEPPSQIQVVQNKVSSARKSLQGGYEATKHSKDGVFSHEKRVFLSLDSQKLCWCEKDQQSDYKSIPLEVITKVRYGVIGEGIVKHVKRLNPLDYCVVDYLTGDYKKKTIELEALPDEMRRFAQELETIVNFSRVHSLNSLVQS